MDVTPLPLAVVTGGSSGIGLELVREFAENGFEVLSCAEDDTDLQIATQTLVADGHPVRSLTADLATPEGVERLVAEIGGRPVDALALNAGVANGGPFLETPLEDDLRVISLDVVSVVHLAKRLLPRMVDRGAGRVLVTSSVAARMPGPYYATYAASKAFVQSFTEAVRYELKDTGVTITALLPGPTDTDFFEASHMEDTRVAEQKKDDPAKVAREGFEALMAGKDQVSTRSLKTRMQTAMGAILPDTAKAAVHAKMTEPHHSDQEA
ncbi:SDR family NAD(P)-dependent oxidoreductase [Cellulomonas sp. NPDC055163]